MILLFFIFCIFTKDYLSRAVQPPPFKEQSGQSDLGQVFFDMKRFLCVYLFLELFSPCVLCSLSSSDLGLSEL